MSFVLFISNLAFLFLLTFQKEKEKENPKQKQHMWSLNYLLKVGSACVCQLL